MSIVTMQTDRIVGSAADDMAPTPPDRIVGRRLRDGFSLIELLLVVSIVAVLSAMLLSGINQVREAARSVACLGSLRQIGLAAQTYSTDNRGQIVPFMDLVKGQMWTKLLNEYITERNAYNDDGTVFDMTELTTGRNVFWGCPKFEGRYDQLGVLQKSSSAYGMARSPRYGDDLTPLPIWTSGQPKYYLYTHQPMFMNSVTCRSQRLMFADSRDWQIWKGVNMAPPRRVLTAGAVWLDVNGPRHRNWTTNVCFYDGHVAAVAADKVSLTFTNPALYEP